MGIPQGSEWILIVLVVVLLFGAKKLPEAARGLGRSLRIFKSEVKQTNEPLDELEPGAVAVPPTAIAAAPLQAPVAPVVVSQIPVQAPAPAHEPAPAPVDTMRSGADTTSVQAVTENFYGQERSGR